MKKHYRWLSQGTIMNCVAVCLFLTLATISSSGFGGDALDAARRQQQIDVARSVKVMRFVVDEDYAAAKGVSMAPRLLEVTRKMLDPLGMSLVRSDAKDFCVTLYVKVRGEPLPGFYMVRGEGMQQTQRLFTGAALRCDVSLVVGTKIIYSNYFVHREDPSGAVFADNRKRPEDAPFRQALWGDHFDSLSNWSPQPFGSDYLTLLSQMITLLLNNDNGTPLIPFLQDKPSLIRDSAIAGIGWTKCRSAVPDLVRMLKDDVHFGDRQHVRWALAKIGDKQAVGLLIRLFAECKDSAERKSLSRNLKEITGWDLPADPVLWRKAWQEKKDGFTWER